MESDLNHLDSRKNYANIDEVVTCLDSFQNTDKVNTDRIYRIGVIKYE